MNTHKEEPLRLGGQAVDDWLARRYERLAAELVDGFAATIPIYGRFPPDLRRDILWITRHNLDMFIGMLRQRQAPSAEDLAPLAESASRRAEEGVPLADVLTAYHQGIRVTWTQCASLATPDDHDDLVSVSTLVFEYQQIVTSVVATAYAEERQNILGHEREARRALVTALLDGQPAEELAERAGVHLAPGYLVLCLSFGSAEDSDGRRAAISDRRRVRAVASVLEVWPHGQVLTILDPHGGTALLPIKATEPGRTDAISPAERASLRESLAALDFPVLAAAHLSTIERVPVVHTTTREVVDLVERLDYPPGIYQLADVLLEYQFTRPGPGADVLAELLAPLERGTELETTLETYLRHDLSRNATAAALNVHPNTLDYRLNRIARLTGLNPSRQSDLHKLTAALIARRHTLG
ncbi:PucR family transcriptional regulator [Stackebrandtia nassauensis]|uniref:Transcriptional regulator, CdaR n=1 Tax=Stackebrandtia nassauensis (strain DSM 44728 / CIP 108903 / NRRL B-16338 / NBRC 102104 / LLR-40K-21) TaxID=446470 RepID=D3Q1J0_STANL|nr:helix-turn-helix domain-containing protein [Stackebrandtia nassauensis]ADD39838.1 transcriptional regulator, CdaR [Stackebrandtia nassauensis DSM 44728]